MQRLPSKEECQWLTHALKKLVAKRGLTLLDATPLVEPTKRWFPEPWNSTAAHGHRLAQRLMHYAGLTGVEVSLSAFLPHEYDDENQPWDRGTAGWFAGIRDKRARFGLQVGQFNDPEAAAGVLAHEVAHAWREQHRFVIDDREKEELLTDLTTIALGFGILTTNNTDRYRSSGTWSVTTWSVSSAGYLPPHAMAYALALWTEARAIAGEKRIIEKHLEPNQAACFRTALDSLANEVPAARERLGAGPKPQYLREIDWPAFTPSDPSPDQIREPERAKPDSQPNRGTTVYRTPRASTFAALLFALPIAFLFGWIGGTIAWDEQRPFASLVCGAVTALLAALLVRVHTRRLLCTGCGEQAAKDTADCTHCGGIFGGVVTARELRRIREEELDRRAAADVDYDECADCVPEHPCPAHEPDSNFELDSVKAPSQPATDPDVRPAVRVSPRLLTYVVLAILLSITALGVWRQTFVPFYVDNALGQPVIVRLDGEALRADGRPPFRRTIRPGRHHIVTTGSSGQRIEEFDTLVQRQSIFDALWGAQFVVYNVDARGIYRFTSLVYAEREFERHTDASLIAFQRWITRERVDYLFAEPPGSLQAGAGAKLRRTAFTIADVSLAELARERSEAGRFEEAVDTLRRGLARNRCDERLRNDLVEILSATGQDAKAMETAEEWVATCGSSSIEAHRALQNLTPKDRLGEMLARYRARLEADPSAANHYLFGRLLDGADAVTHYRVAVQKDPRFTRARSALGFELLAAEKDDEAFVQLDEAMLADDVDVNVPRLYAMAAVAANELDRADEVLFRSERFDPLTRWEARWTLMRARADWPSGRVMLAERIARDSSPETTVLRARLNWETGTPVSGLIADLINQPETRDAGYLLAFEDALERGAAEEAASIESTHLRTDDAPSILSVYAAEALLLAGETRETATESLRSLLQKAAPENAHLLVLLDAADGRLPAEQAREKIAGAELTFSHHLAFALGVRAKIHGDSATAATYFHRAAARTLDREFPYRLAMKLASKP